MSAWNPKLSRRTVLIGSSVVAAGLGLGLWRLRPRGAVVPSV